MRAFDFRPIRDERGVALPLALLGLVSVSLLVTTALVTSSTELAISGAHEDATAALYTAEGGLQAYVAENGTAVEQDAGQGDFTYSPPGGGADVVLSVIHLGTQLQGDGSTARLYNVMATPSSGGGRTVSAMITQLIPAPVPLNLNITSAMTVGGDLSVTGNAFDVNGRSTACGSTGMEALRIAGDSELTLGNENQYNTRVQRFIGTSDAGSNVAGDAAIQRGGTRIEMVNSLLNGRSIDEIANDVPDDDWRYRTATPTYSSAWLSTVLNAAGDGVAVVDAQGGSISLNPGTYTGILIVLNGDVSMSGNITFNGVIIAERNFSLAGAVTVNGAIASLAMDGQNVVNNAADDNSVGNGTVTVNYNKCTVDNAVQAYANAVAAGATPSLGRTVSWLEVVR